MTRFVAWDIGVTVQFSLWFGSWAWEPQLKPETSSAFFTVYQNMTHICLSQWQILHVWTRELVIHLCLWKKNMKNWPKLRDVMIVINNYCFLSTNSVQLLMKCGKRESSKERKRGEKYVWTTLGTTEQHISQESEHSMDSWMSWSYIMPRKPWLSSPLSSSQTFLSHQRSHTSIFPKLRRHTCSQFASLCPSFCFNQLITHDFLNKPLNSWSQMRSHDLWRLIFGTRK